MFNVQNDKKNTGIIKALKTVSAWKGEPSYVKKALLIKELKAIDTTNQQ